MSYQSCVLDGLYAIRLFGAGTGGTDGGQPDAGVDAATDDAATTDAQ